MTIKVTLGGVEYPADLDSFLKVEATWPYLRPIREAFLRKGAPTPEFPDGVPDPDIGAALTGMLKVVAIATFPMDDVTDKEFKARLENWISWIREKTVRAEFAGVRECFSAVTAEGELTGNDEAAAPAAVEPAPLSTGTSTASTPNS